MPTKKEIWETAVIVLCLIGISWAAFYLLSSSSSEQKFPNQGRKTTKPPTTIKEPVASIPGPEEEPEPPEDLSPEEKRVVEKERQFRKGIAEQANRPLGFYGKVVDQAGQPVPGVQIQARIAYHQGIWVPELKQKVFSVRTDAKGRFAITNQKGTNLYIEKLHKKGYISEVGPTSFKAHYLGDQEKATPEPPNNQDPVIFKIWKKQEPADLITGRRRAAYHPNRPFHPLEVPRTNGALQIKFQTTEEGTRSDPGDWSVSLKIYQGGLIETDNVYMYKAPRSGYQSKWGISFEKKDGPYKSTVQKKFYLKAKNGKVYGRIKVKFNPYGLKVKGQKASYVYWDYAINPHGSRNLLGKYD